MAKLRSLVSPVLSDFVRETDGARQSPQMSKNQAQSTQQDNKHIKAPGRNLQCKKAADIKTAVWLVLSKILGAILHKDGGE